MTSHVVITVGRPRGETERLWHQAEHPVEDATVTFEDAPGDRGTEIHVVLAGRGGLGGAVQGLRGAAPLAKVKDDLRRFKQRVETGEIPRSDGAPEGELAGRKLRQQPAQPREEVGAR
jgi:uncharacterized membrane protein